MICIESLIDFDKEYACYVPEINEIFIIMKNSEKKFILVTWSKKIKDNHLFNANKYYDKAVFLGEL